MTKETVYWDLHESVPEACAAGEKPGKIFSPLCTAMIWD